MRSMHIWSKEAVFHRGSSKSNLPRTVRVNGEPCDRLPKLLANMERSVKGPFYFGDSPTYVNFLLCCVMDWTEETVLTAIKAAPAQTVSAASASTVRRHVSTTPRRFLDRSTHVRTPC